MMNTITLATFASFLFINLVERKESQKRTSTTAKKIRMYSGFIFLFASRYKLFLLQIAKYNCTKILLQVSVLLIIKQIT